MTKTSCLIIILLVLSAGCDVVDEGGIPKFYFEFWMSDAYGNIRTEYETGEEVFFHWKLTNISGSTQYWMQADDLPYVEFIVYDLNSEIIGSTLESDIWTSPRNGELPNGATLTYETYWLRNDQNSAFSAGSYRVEAHPLLSFENLKDLEVYKIDFTVR